MFLGVGTGESSDNRVKLFLGVRNPLKHMGIAWVWMCHADHILAGYLKNDCLAYCLWLVAHALLGDDFRLYDVAHVGEFRGEEGKVVGQGNFLFLLHIHLGGFSC